MFLIQSKKSLNWHKICNSNIITYYTQLIIDVYVQVKVTQLCPTLCNPCFIQSMGFSRLEYWSEWPFPSPGDLPDSGIELGSSALQADPLPAELTREG